MAKGEGYSVGVGGHNRLNETGIIAVAVGTSVITSVGTSVITAVGVFLLPHATSTRLVSMSAESRVNIFLFTILSLFSVLVR